MRDLSLMSDLELIDLYYKMQNIEAVDMDIAAMGGCSDQLCKAWEKIWDKFEEEFERRKIHIIDEDEFENGLPDVRN